VNTVIDTLNMQTVPITRIVRQIREQLEDEDYTPVTILGKSGIGKTESIRDLANELGIGLKELRLSHYQESDLVGLPYVENGQTHHAASDILPDTNDEGQGILLLDEVTSASKSMRSAVYQLLDVSRGLGQYKLPERWLVVACGNGPDDGGDFRGIEPAFVSRGFCWRVEENFYVWKDWALRHHIHPVVISYLKFRPDNLHVMDQDRPFDMIACPRNWSKLSTLLSNLEKRTSDGIISNLSDLEFASDGCVGVKCGPAFAAFYQNKKNMIDPRDILDGKVSIDRMKNLSDEVLYLTAQTLVQLMIDEIKEAKAATDSGVNEECMNRISGACKWIVDVGNKVRLDTAISIFQDITTTLGDDFKSIVLSEKFDEISPEFADFASENALIL